jgi:hypothetical protein
MVLPLAPAHPPEHYLSAEPELEQQQRLSTPFQQYLRK